MPVGTGRAGRTFGVRKPRTAIQGERAASAKRAARPPKLGDIFHAKLTGFQEVPPVLTPGKGTFFARLAPNGRSIEYELTFSNLTTPSTAAHIHFGQRGVNGGIFAFLCGGDDKPDCPGTGGTVIGTINADDILALPEQGLEAGDIRGALRIITSGAAYVNVHSVKFPAGEIRGQIRRN